MGPNWWVDWLLALALLDAIWGCALEALGSPAKGRNADGETAVRRPGSMVLPQPRIGLVGNRRYKEVLPIETLGRYRDPVGVFPRAWHGCQHENQEAEQSAGSFLHHKALAMVSSTAKTPAGQVSRSGKAVSLLSISDFKHKNWMV